MNSDPAPASTALIPGPRLRGLVVIVMTLAGCIDSAQVATSSTAAVLERAAPAMNMEPDYKLAAQAIPAHLKLIEGFHLAEPDDERLIALLAEGFCQYAAGFIEDEVERAAVAGDLRARLDQEARAKSSFLRCTEYALLLLPKGYRQTWAGPFPAFARQVVAAKRRHRDALMWLGIGLAGAIEHGKRDFELLTHLPKAQALLERVVELDDAGNGGDPMMRALPHLTLGRLHTARAAVMGGDPPRGRAHLERALKITGSRLLLAKVYMAKGFARITGNRPLFRAMLVDVLRSNPAIWPEQRLVNEIAMRRARRYLILEDEWF
ncbi:MAG: TRAP transporter TatT component family protein [Deltaproteobacteria bacterium]|nr:TRAP transporter TatT component family protein [Deltaproteobacteria bacterium]